MSNATFIAPPAVRRTNADTYIPPFSTPWNAGIKAALAASNTQLCTVLDWGCSTGSGVGASDWYTTSYFARVKQWILGQGYQFAGDYISQQEHAANAIQGTTIFSDALNGVTLGISYPAGWNGMECVVSGATAVYHQQLTVPYAANVTLFYLDYTAGTWVYKVGAGGDQTVTNVGDGSSSKTQIKSISLGQLASGTVVTWGKQSVALGCIVLGASFQVSTTGVFFSWMCVPSGGTLYSYSLQGSGSSWRQFPYDRTALFAGMTPQISFPTVHHWGLQAPTVNSTATAGNVPIGTWDYALTAVGNQGTNGQTESQLGPILSGVAVTASAKQVVLNIAPDQASYPNADIQSTTALNLYRRTNPAGTWGKVATSAGNTATTITDNAAAIGAAPPASDPPMPTFTGWGIPFQNVSLAIFEYGIDDLGSNANMYTQQQQQGVEARMVEALRTNNPNCSILSWASWSTPILSDILQNNANYGPYLSLTANPEQLGYAVYQNHRVIADAYNMAVVQSYAMFRNTLAGIINLFSHHINDTGHQSVANSIIAALQYLP